MEVYAQSPWVKHMRALELVALLSLALIASILIISTCDYAEAANGDTFEVDELYYSERADGNLSLIENTNNPYTGSITVPSTVTYGGHSYNVTAVEEAFKNNANVTSVYLPDSVTFIGARSFNNCSNLVNVHLGNAVTSLNGFTFTSCRDLTNVNLPDTITSIGQNDFYGCRELTSVILPSALTQIGAGAFNSCIKLSSVTIRSNIVTIGDNAFTYCAITSLTIPNSVISIGISAFSNCSSLQSVELGTGLTEIPVTAFRSCTSLKTLTIGDNITKIGSSAFVSCTGLKTVAIGNNVTSIGADAFSGCSTLKYLSLGSSVTNIGDDAFSGTGICKITLPSSLVSLGDRSFNCNNLLEICNNSNIALSLPSPGHYHSSYITNNVKNIYSSSSGSSIFHEMIMDNSSKAVYYTDTESNGIVLVDVIGDNTDLILPDSINGNGYSLISKAFRCDTEIESLTIGLGVTSIGTEAFANCTNLSVIDFGNGITSLNSYIFKGCTSLTSINIPSNIKIIDGFTDCTNLCNVILPDGAEEICDHAFANTGITTISFPNSIKTIGSYAFAYTNITSITFGTGLLQLSSDSFNGYTFYDSDGTTVLSQTVSNMKGFTFVGTSITNMVRLSNNCTITFCKDDGSVHTTKVYEKGTSLNSFDVTLTKEQTAQYTYTLSGWKYANNTAVTFPFVVNSNVSLYPVWTETIRSYYVLYYSDAGDLIQSGKYSYGTVITPIAGPDKDPDGMFTYTFNSWYGYSENMFVQGRTVFTAVYDKTPIIPADRNEVVIYAADDGFVKFSDDNIEDLKEKAKTEDVSLTVTVSEGTVVFDKEAIKTFTGGNDLSIAKLDNEKFDQSIKDIVGDAPTYQIYFGENRSFGDGMATIIIPYTLKGGDDPNNLIVYYLQDGRIAQRISCTYENGYVTFVTNHFSTYAIVSEEASDDNGSNIGLIIGAAVAGLAAVLIAAAIIVKKH